MSSGLSNQDFQRLQENLLELKTRNYTLEEDAKKSKHGLADATVRIRVLEESLSKANKAIDKSKKAQEVQHLLKENSFLQEKLAFQDEQYRLQNETLMQELTSLVQTNEVLERQLSAASKSPSTSAGDSSLEAVHRLEAENQDLKASLHILEETCAQLTADTERRHRPEPQPALQSSEEKEEVLVDSHESLAVAAQLRAEADALRAELAKSVQSCEEVRGRLEQLAAEKEQDLAEFTEARHQFERKEEGLDAVATAAKRRADQLTAELEARSERFQELEAARICLDNEIVSLKDQLHKEKETSALLKNDLAKALEREEVLKRELESSLASLTDLMAQLEGAKKTSESRKNLIDEMALELQKKSEEARSRELELTAALTSSSQAEAELKSRLADLQQELEGRQAEVKKWGANYAALSARLDAAEEARQWQEAELRRKDEAFAAAEERHRRQVGELREDREREREVLESEGAARLAAINTQLELANVQRVEFEEAVERMKQEARDILEDKKIAEKKGQALLKDLTRQLQQEKKRNEKLQERMKDCLIETYSNCSDPSKELDPERSSISSWSLMSGHNERERDMSSTPSQASPTDSSASGIEQSKRGVGKSLDSLANSSSLGGAGAAAASAAAAVAAVQQENDVLLGRLADLQQDKWRLEERVLMIEQSAAAMADEICRKNELIQFYCMEAGGRVVGGGRATQPVQSPTSPPEKVRNFVNNLVHYDQADSHAKEVHRMQQILEETLTKNMHLQHSLDHLSQEVVRLSKVVGPEPPPLRQQQHSSTR